MRAELWTDHCSAWEQQSQFPGVICLDFQRDGIILPSTTETFAIFKAMLKESERLIYAKFTSQDFDDYCGLVMNAQVMHFITGKALNEEEALERFEKTLEDNDRNAELGTMSVRRKENGEFIGLAKITDFDKGRAEIGYVLLPEHWGLGYASEMVTALIGYAETLETLYELVAIVDPDNPASIRVLKKHGFALYKTGTYKNLPAEYYMRAL